MENNNLLKLVSKKILKDSKTYTYIGYILTITKPNINLNELMMVFAEKTHLMFDPLDTDLDYLQSIREKIRYHRKNITSTITLDPKTIKKLLCFTGNDVSRPALNNIHITSDYIEATNGYRFLRISQNTGANGLHFLPKDLAKIIAKQKSSVTIEFSSDFAQITVNNIIVFQELYKGEYPNCNLIIPDFSKLDANFPVTKVIFEAKDMKEVESAIVDSRVSREIPRYAFSIPDNSSNPDINASFLKDIYKQTGDFTGSIARNMLKIENRNDLYLVALMKKK